MWDYLSAPLDADRAHLIADGQIWHARVMFIAWGVCAPLAVLVARYFKVLPGQDWPNQLDSQLWWRSHWMVQTLVMLVTIVSVAYMYLNTPAQLSLHGRIGYIVLSLVCFQALIGVFRGSKGGPTEPAADGSWHGDHYSMTRRRRLFERVHKSVGYVTLLLAAAVIVTGYWMVNAPRWMWLVTVVWWSLLLVAAFIMQHRGLALDTYQAIWGPDNKHPGNRITPIGWGVNRPAKKIHNEMPPEHSSGLIREARVSQIPAEEHSE